MDDFRCYLSRWSQIEEPKHNFVNFMQGISTYDYIIALREQEQEEISGQQSPQMSHVSSYTGGLSSTSSFGALRRGSWCTPPRLFLEDQVRNLYRQT
jgi:hypothetical protein